MSASPDSPLLAALSNGPALSFASWTRSAIPESPGVYSVWRGEVFIYVGMAGRSSTQNSGLRSRLLAHTSGRRSGDQFCVYVCDRLVIPKLTPAQQADIESGTASLDRMTKAFIHAELAFRYVIVNTPAEARALEGASRSVGLGTAGKPLLNPAEPRG